MAIYPSSKVMSYVYKCIHKTTGKIYIGSRANKNQKLPSHLDLPKYKTSSYYVKPIFDEFDWHIVAEFFDPKDAYNFEQQLIHDQWQVSKEMSLNGICHHNKKTFNVIGRNTPKSKEHRKSIGDTLRGKSLSEEHVRSMSKIIDVLTPDGFVIENITMKELCSQFNLNYGSIARYFRENRPYMGFTIIVNP